MSKFNLYFALTGALVRDCILPRMVDECNVSNYLASYFYINEFIDSEVFNKMMTKAEQILFMIDSGAYSAWNSGGEVDLDKYIQFCHSFKKKYLCKETYFINLDKIPGSPGQAPTAEQVQASVNEGARNAKKMKESGIESMEVFHQGEDFKFLEKMIETSENPYIGVSPANDVFKTGRQVWLEKVFGVFAKKNVKVRTHGFGVTAFDLMRLFPWTSCDSATYSILAGYGGVLIFDPSIPKLSTIKIGVTKGDLTVKNQLANRWKYLHHLFPPFVNEPTMLESLAIRTLVNAYSLVKSAEWINLNTRGFSYQESWEDLL